MKYAKFLSLVAIGVVTQQASAQYDAPATYYSSINTQTGTALKDQLRTITSSMTGINYGNARYSAPYTDVDPNNASNVLLIYNRASVSAVWDGGNSWNREHIWPVSRLGVGDPSNTTTAISTDQFNLRPANPSINSSRQNTPFGPDSGNGSYGYQSGVYYPGDADAGDVARAQFYMATRYTTLSLIDSGTPTGTQMGDLSSLLRFHYKDVPDNFERRRNHAIYGSAGVNSPAISNPYKQGNRNPYVDHPEYAWSVFADQQNDTQLSVGAVDSLGGSSTNVNLGRVLRNAPLPAAQNVTLNKTGIDGTYYSVTATGQATSIVTGRFNAFTMGASGNRSIGVGLNTSTSTAGLKSGSVVIDNLDITTQGGDGHGAKDANDTINVSLSVLDASNSSFSAASDTNTLSLNFGSVQLGAADPTLPFSIANFASASLGASLTAKLDLDSIVESGDASGVFLTNLTAFDELDAGTSIQRLAQFDTSQLGAFTATYTLNFSDEDLPGNVSMTQLTLNVSGAVVPEPATVGVFVSAACAVLLSRRRR